MIDIEVRQHDSFSVEFKSGVTITKQSPDDINDFMINTWIFVPNSLDINRATYSKEQFYKDVKTNIRLITPIYTLKEILVTGRGPFSRLDRAIEILLESPENEKNAENLSYHVRMLMCITNSALRRESNNIIKSKKTEEQISLVEKFVENSANIVKRYREYKNLSGNEHLTPQQREMFLFGDDFMGNIIEKYTFSILRELKNSEAYPSIKPILTELVKEQSDYKKTKGFMVLDKEDSKRNSLVILQRNILKKIMESDLFLQVIVKRDGAFAKQVYYGIAAGVAMIFATVISFIATQRLGNFTTDLFIILVISYVFKDRIKDVMRYYFSSHLSKKYFDNKLNLSIRKQEIGYMKESFDFIEEDRLPGEIRSLRNRTPLVEAENKVYGEKILLYRKWISLSKKEIETYKEYRLTGVNDITQFNLINYLQKMDNPSIPLYTLDKSGDLETFKGEKVYSLYFILSCISDSTEYYRKYRILFNRKGITDIKELN